MSAAARPPGTTDPIAPGSNWVLQIENLPGTVLRRTVFPNEAAMLFGLLHVKTKALIAAQRPNRQ